MHKQSTVACYVTGYIKLPIDVVKDASYLFRQYLLSILFLLGIPFLLLLQVDPFSLEDQLSLLVLVILEFDQR